MLERSHFFPIHNSETFRMLQQSAQKMTQLTLFGLKWPVHDHVLVHPRPAKQDHAQTRRDNFEWRGGEGGEVSVTSHRSVTSSDLK